MRWKKFLVVAGGAAIIVLAAVVINAHLLILGPFIKAGRRAAPATSTLAIIFGGGLKADGTQSAFQEDRVRRGVALYQSGAAARLLMTGDDGGNHDDEIAAMKLLAIKLGVPSRDIDLDPHGYRTYESCYRARAVYGIASALVVSQSFHLPRIIYLCEGMGVKATGVSADRRQYQTYYWYRSEAREILARVKAWWQLEVARPAPKSLAR